MGVSGGAEMATLANGPVARLLAAEISMSRLLLRRPVRHLGEIEAALAAQRVGRLL